MQKVASVNSNTIVVVNSVGPIIMEAWIDSPNGMYNNDLCGYCLLRYDLSSHCCGKIVLRISTYSIHNFFGSRFGAACLVKKQETLWSMSCMARITPGNFFFKWVGMCLIDKGISGRLPYTIAKSADDYPAQIADQFTLVTIPINYTEGLFIDYRHFDAVGGCMVGLVKYISDF